MGGGLAGLEPSEMISAHLVTFDDISHVQTQNAQLLRVVRALSRQQDEQESARHREADVEQEALKEAMRELGGMREDRQVAELPTYLPTYPSRTTTASLALAPCELILTLMPTFIHPHSSTQATEQMVVGLVQQRDMYRAMLQDIDASKQGSTDDGSTGTGAAGAGAGVGAALSPGGALVCVDGGGAGGAVSPPKALDGELRDLQWKLRQTEEALKRSTERVERLSETETLLRSSVDQVSLIHAHARAHSHTHPVPTPVHIVVVIGTCHQAQS